MDVEGAKMLRDAASREIVEILRALQARTGLPIEKAEIKLVDYKYANHPERPSDIVNCFIYVRL